MQLFHYVAVRSTDVPTLGQLGRDGVLALFELLGALRTAIEDVDEEDLATATPRLRTLGRGWRDLDGLLDAVESGDGEVPSIEAVSNLLDRIPGALHPFAFELVGYAGMDDEGTFRGAELVSVMVEATALAEPPPEVERGRRARWGGLDYGASAPHFENVGATPSDREDGPQGEAALRNAVVKDLMGHGVHIPSTRTMASSELEATDPHRLLLWWWDLTAGVYLFALPEAELDDGARALLDTANGVTFATAADVDPDVWEALVEVMARLGGDHMPVGGRERAAAGSWTRFACGSVSHEAGVIDEGGLNHRLRGVVSVRRLA